MTTNPFTPIGDVARWRTIYDLLVMHDVDDIITYEVMAEELNLDPIRERQLIQQAMQRAAKEFEDIDKHAVTAVPNIGYRIVKPAEHLQLARDLQRRSSKALVRGQSKVVNVDMSELSPANQALFQAVAQAFAMQQEFNRRTDVRQKKLEQSLGTIREQTARTDDEVAELKERLKKLEERKNEDGGR